MSTSFIVDSQTDTELDLKTQVKYVLDSSQNYEAHVYKPPQTIGYYLQFSGAS